MTAILAFILTNKTLLAIVVAGLGMLGISFASAKVARRAERNANRAKDADAYEQHLKELADAANAGNRVRPSDGLSDDPYNRDR